VWTGLKAARKTNAVETEKTNNETMVLPGAVGENSSGAVNLKGLTETFNQSIKQAIDLLLASKTPSKNEMKTINEIKETMALLGAVGEISRDFVNLFLAIKAPSKNEMKRFNELRMKRFNEIKETMALLKELKMKRFNENKETMALLEAVGEISSDLLVVVCDYSSGTVNLKGFTETFNESVNQTIDWLFASKTPSKNEMKTISEIKETMVLLGAVGKKSSGTVNLKGLTETFNISVNQAIDLLLASKAPSKNEMKTIMEIKETMALLGAVGKNFSDLVNLFLASKAASKTKAAETKKTNETTMLPGAVGENSGDTVNLKGLTETFNASKAPSKNEMKTINEMTETMVLLDMFGEISSAIVNQFLASKAASKTKAVETEKTNNETMVLPGTVGENSRDTLNLQGLTDMVDESMNQSIDLLLASKKKPSKKEMKTINAIREMKALLAGAVGENPSDTVNQFPANNAASKMKALESKKTNETTVVPGAVGENSNYTDSLNLMMDAVKVNGLINQYLDSKVSSKKKMKMIKKMKEIMARADSENSIDTVNQFPASKATSKAVETKRSKETTVLPGAVGGKSSDTANLCLASKAATKTKKAGDTMTLREWLSINRSRTTDDINSEYISGLQKGF